MGVLLLSTCPAHTSVSIQARHGWGRPCIIEMGQALHGHNLLPALAVVSESFQLAGWTSWIWYPGHSKMQAIRCIEVIAVPDALNTTNAGHARLSHVTSSSSKTAHVYAQLNLCSLFEGLIADLT
jgi:hypothetical protein